MAKPIPPVRTCVLSVGIKCCKGCQTKAKRKLLSFTGVSSVEYNAEQGLLTVSGDVNPIMLLDKLTKWGKHVELVSVLGDNSSPVPRTPEINQSKTMKEKKRPIKCCLLMYFGKRSSNTKVDPLATMQNRNYRGAEDQNGNAINVGAPPIVYPPPQAMPGFATTIPYPPPYFGSRPPPYTDGIFRPVPPPYTGGILRSAPPQFPPYIQFRPTEFPNMVNSRLHHH